MSEQKKTFGMRMAKADQKDLETAFTLNRILDNAERGYLIIESDDGEWLDIDIDDSEDAQLLARAVMDCFSENPSGLSRVLMAASSALDERNQLFDPDKDYLDFHPRIAQAEQQRDELLDIVERYANTYLRDEYDSAEFCVDEDEHMMVCQLFAAIAKARQLQP